MTDIIQPGLSRGSIDDSAPLLDSLASPSNETNTAVPYVAGSLSTDAATAAQGSGSGPVVDRPKSWDSLQDPWAPGDQIEPTMNPEGASTEDLEKYDSISKNNLTGLRDAFQWSRDTHQPLQPGPGWSQLQIDTFNALGHLLNWPTDPATGQYVANDYNPDVGPHTFGQGINYIGLNDLQAAYADQLRKLGLTTLYGYYGLT